MKKVLLIASYDSFLNSGYAVAKEIKDAQIDIYIHKSRENILSNRQLLESGIDKDQAIFFHIDDYFIKNMHQYYDAVILSVGNGLLKRFFKQNAQLNIASRPLIITLFSGIVFGDQASILSRMGADIVLYNNKHDFRIAEEYKKQYKLSCQNILYGYPIFRHASKGRHGEKIYFIDQVKIPFKKEERIYTLKKLIALAEKYPEKEFTILLRVADKDITVHQDKHSYIELAKQFQLPSNLTIERKSTAQAFQEMGYCLSYSSTMLFEAECKGIPVGVVADLGFSKSYANQHFLGSGVLVYFDQIDFTSPKIADPDWLDCYATKKVITTDEFNKLLKQVVPLQHDYQEYLSAVNSIESTKTIFLRKFKKLIRDPKKFFYDSKWLRKVI
ncbi:TPA: DUF6716 putative glycosyltransferase [Neisseria meningitidis]